MKKIILLSFALLGMVFTGVSQTATKVSRTANSI